MRLICGMLHLDGASASEGLLRAMVAQMDVPRLRSSVRLWQDGPVGLAVLEFSPRGASAPSLAETATVTIAADVRLDDPAALARMLGHNGALADDALLLETLERFGPSGLDRVLGDFAFARWEARAERLLCGRDVFGIRPLAYTHQPGKLFAFASLPKALYGAGIVAKKVDEDAVARRAVWKFRYDDSLIAGIKRLPPAHTIEVSREGISLTRYWQLDRAALGTAKCTPETAARELRRLTDEAVKCRLPRDAGIGAHLSGGLDSSALAVLAARQLHQQGRMLHAYSFLDRRRNDVTLEDETEFVQAVLDQERDIDWTPISPSSASPGKVLPIDADKMIRLDAEAPEDAVCRRAEEQGVGLVLSGWGGDEGATFQGVGSLAELFLRGRWRKMAREISALKRERGTTAAHIFASHVASFLMPAALQTFIKNITGRAPHLRTAFLQVLTSEARQHLAAAGNEGLFLAPDGRENRWRWMTSPHIAERAEIWAQTGARHGLAFAFPLLDRRVVEFALSLPSELFIRDGFKRRPFRDAMVDVLPARVRLRHHKYNAFPGRMIDIVESKPDFLAQIDAYEKNESVRRLIDLSRLRQLVEAFPSPEHIRKELSGNDAPAAALSLITAEQMLLAAAYLNQHGSD